MLDCSLNVFAPVTLSLRLDHVSQVSAIMGQTIVQKLGGLQVISPLLNSNKVNLQRNTVALVGNLTKNPVLHSAIGEEQNQNLSIWLHSVFVFIGKMSSVYFKYKCNSVSKYEINKMYQKCI